MNWASATRRRILLRTVGGFFRVVLGETAYFIICVEEEEDTVPQDEI
jgi:hypothetical protein